ncbi:MAG: glycosyltransferase [Pedobacter sp.]|nr:glycosyltransferase [Pedobacter sp.]
MEKGKKKIAILELDNKNHSSLIYNWISVANLNHWDLLLITDNDLYQNVRKEVEAEQFSLFLKNGDESLPKFLWRTKQHLEKNKVDFLVVLTMQTFFIEYLIILLFSTKIGVTIHNARTWFHQNKISKPTHLLKRIIRKIWMKRASFFIVNSEAMNRYVSTNFAVKKQLLVMPFSMRRSHLEKNSDAPFTVVYPGMISKTRKKYDNFLLLAADNPDIQFVLLGSPNKKEGGDQVIEEILAKGIKNIRYFLSYIEPGEFAAHMSQSSILFTELVIEYENSDFSEIYGITKDSGISYLMYEFAKPAFLNAEFSNLDYLREGTFYFDGASDLLAKFKNLRSDQKIMEEARENLSNSVDEVNLAFIAKKISSLNHVI